MNDAALDTDSQTMVAVWLINPTSGPLDRAGLPEPVAALRSAPSIRPCLAPDAAAIAEDGAPPIPHAMVPAEALARWEAAVAAFDAAQQEIAPYFEAAAGVAAERRRAAEERRKQEEHRQWMADWERRRAAREEQEQRNDKIDGPREWVVVHKAVYEGSSIRYTSAPTGNTVHHHTCSYLSRVSEPSSLSQGKRFADVIDMVLTQPYSGSRAVPTTVCRRCAGRVSEQADFLRAMTATVG